MPDSDVVNSDSSFVNADSNFTSDEGSFINKDSSFINPSSSFINSNLPSIGIFNIAVSKTQQDVYDIIVDSVIQELFQSSYAKGYGKWLEIAGSANANVRQSFVRYFSDWQWKKEKENFFEYAKTRVGREKELECMYNVSL